MSRWQKLSRWSASNARALVTAPYRRLFLESDTAGWVLDEEAKEMVKLAASLGFGAGMSYRLAAARPQCVHYTSFFSLENPAVFRSRHRISVDYFHGKPNQDEAFRRVFASVKAHASRLHRVRLSYSEMRPVVLEAGIDPARVHLIPIGINEEYFTFQTPESRQRMRRELGIPEAAVVIGSFQKDGQGWGDGSEPKWVKGPDVFLRAIEELWATRKDIFVLLTGPARGFVKHGLARLGVPYKHFLFDHYPDINRFYQALDLYMVSSREEGGPKAVLESMITGVPLVTTKVGQAVDLAQHEKNALVVEVEDHAALASQAARVLDDSALRARLIANGKETAAAETYRAQLPRWEAYFAGFVEQD